MESQNPVAGQPVRRPDLNQTDPWPRPRGHSPAFPEQSVTRLRYQMISSPVGALFALLTLDWRVILTLPDPTYIVFMGGIPNPLPCHCLRFTPCDFRFEFTRFSCHFSNRRIVPSSSRAGESTGSSSSSRMVFASSSCPHG